MKEPKKYTVKERIIHYLKKSKITQSEFCKRVGLSSALIPQHFSLTIFISS